MKNVSKQCLLSTVRGKSEFFFFKNNFRLSILKETGQSEICQEC